MVGEHLPIRIYTFKVSTKMKIWTKMAASCVPPKECQLVHTDPVRYMLHVLFTLAIHNVIVGATNHTSIS